MYKRQLKMCTSN